MGAFTTTTRCAALVAGRKTDARFVGSVELSDREPCILLPRKSPVPSVREVKQSHVEHEHWIVSPRGTPENPQQVPLGIGLRLFGFHF
jgi:hypothetical protein